MKKIFSLMTVLLIVLGTVCFMSCGDDDETPDSVQPPHTWFVGRCTIEGSTHVETATGNAGAGTVGSGIVVDNTYLRRTVLDFMSDGTLLVYDLISGETSGVYESTEGSWTTFEYNPECSYFKGTVVDKTGRHESPRKYHYVIGGKDGKIVVTDDKGGAWEYGTIYADLDAQNKFRKLKDSEGKILFVLWNPTSGSFNALEFE